MNTRSDVVAQFGREAGDPETFSALQNLMDLHALTIEDLHIKWEQFSYQKREKSTDLSPENLEQFKQYLQLQVEKKAAQASAAISNPSSVSKKPKPLKPLQSSPSLFGFNIPRGSSLKKRKLNAGSNYQDTEAGSKLEFSQGPSEDNINKENELSHGNADTSMSTPPNLRSMRSPAVKSTFKSGEIKTSLNPEEMEVACGLQEDSEKRINITPFYDPEKYKFRTMRQNISDAADVLDMQIEIIAEIVQNHYKLSASEFGDPTIQAQSEIHAVGRIVPESPSDESVNTESLALETSRMAGIGRRVRLNLTDVNEVSLFLGQIVAVKGKNADGDSFKATEFLPLPYPESPVSTADEIQTHQEALNGDPLKVTVISGPFTSNDSFDFSHLTNFVERLNTEIKPHAVIMFGPLIDVTHPMIAAGTLPHFPHLKSQPQTLDDLFLKVMAPILKNIRSNIQVILIPSTRDALSKHAAYPQDSLDRKALQLPKNFKCFANPATFQLNEVFFGCSNVDTFKDIKEMPKGGNTSMRDRFDRVSEHILQQRRYYPVFPGGITKKLLPNTEGGNKVYEHISGADLDVPYLGLTEFVGNFTPDIILIPSEMNHFAKVEQNVIMINPGRFVKPWGHQGTYADISISAPDLNNGKLTKIEGPEPVYLHNVWKRARVDIANI